jgi:benzil reductase ((S)-benzoin forming)
MGNSPYVITGGGVGIGQALSWKLAEQNETVVIIGRNKERLEETRSRFPHLITAIQADVVSDREKILQALQPVNNLKGLVHAAALNKSVMPFPDISLEAWQEAQAVILNAPLFLTKTLLPLLKNSRVLLISSMLSHVAHPLLMPYCVSKAGILMMFQCFKADNLSPYVHFGCVTPGIVDTSSFKEVALNPYLPEKYRYFYQHLMNENIALKPEVPACFIHWLLSSVEAEQFSSHEWNIYDTSHHKYWLKDFFVPTLPLELLS